VADPATLVPWATRAATPVATYSAQLALGAAYYRAGKYDAAARQLASTAGSQLGVGTVPAWLFLAMTHYRLGHIDEARRWLSKALEATDRAAPDNASEGVATPASRWTERLQLQLLRKEAESLVKAPTPPR
jgi:hypothetical protein